jgi:ethanolamine ammonia-lyase large subunit
VQKIRVVNPFLLSIGLRGRIYRCNNHRPTTNPASPQTSRHDCCHGENGDAIGINPTCDNLGSICCAD